MSLQLLLIVTLAFGAAQSQDCDSIQTDHCGALIWPFLLDPNQTPSDAGQLETTCTSLREGEQCLRNYVQKCPNVVKKSVTDQVLDSFSTTIVDFCTGNLGRRFLPHGVCLRANLAKNFTCNHDAIVVMEAAAVHEPATEILKLTCCAYLSLDKCFADSVTNACDKKAARAIKNLMQSYAIFMVEKCLPFLSEPGKCDLGVLKYPNSATSRKPKTFLPALLDVAKVAF